jgi:hypothetical protein
LSARNRKYAGRLGSRAFFQLGLLSTKSTQNQLSKSSKMAALVRRISRPIQRKIFPLINYIDRATFLRGLHQMATRAREQAVPENFLHTLVEWLPFAALTLSDQLQVARMIWEDGSKARVHHAVPSATSYSYKDLAQRFQRNRFNTINQTARVFDVGSSWSVRRGETRSFVLTPAYRQIKAQYLRSVVKDRRVSRLIDMRGRQVQSALAAISSKRRNGVTTTLWAGVTIRLNRSGNSGGSLV